MNCKYIYLLNLSASRICRVKLWNVRVWKHSEKGQRKVGFFFSSSFPPWPRTQNFKAYYRIWSTSSWNLEKHWRKEVQASPTYSSTSLYACAPVFQQLLFYSGRAENAYWVECPFSKQRKGWKPPCGSTALTSESRQTFIWWAKSRRLKLHLSCCILRVIITYSKNNKKKIYKILIL
jgi:hypothetical protein